MTWLTSLVVVIWSAFAVCGHSQLIPAHPVSSPVRCSLVGAKGLAFGGQRFNVTLMPTSAFCFGASSNGRGRCLNRTFIITLPLSRFQHNALPLAFALHGGAEEAVDFLDGNDGGRQGASPVDRQLAAAGFITIAPNAVPNPRATEVLSSLGLCPCPILPFWASTFTILDMAAAEGLSNIVDEPSFLWDAAVCVRDVLRVGTGLQLNLSGAVFAFGHSQGAKLSTYFACSEPRHGFSVNGVVSSAGIKVDTLNAPRCMDARRRTPPLLAFQAQRDSRVPFCTPYLYAEGSVYWERWVEMARCSNAIHVPATALCPPVQPSGINGTSTSVMRVFMGQCASPTALFWNRETNPAYGFHLWPGPMSALGGLDATGVAIKFFSNIQAAPIPRDSAQAFAGLVPHFTKCVGLSSLPTGPCGDDSDIAAVRQADFGSSTVPALQFHRRRPV